MKIEICEATWEDGGWTVNVWTYDGTVWTTRVSGHSTDSTDDIEAIGRAQFVDARWLFSPSKLIA